METRNDGTQAIRRAASILKFIARDPENGAALRDVSAAMQLSRSTAHRILKCLVDEQLVAQSQNGKRYMLGNLATELGLATRSRNAEILHWRNAVSTLAHQTRATVYLIGRSGMECVVLDRVEASSIIRVIPAEVGQRHPLGVGSGSTAILASLPEDERESVIAAVAPRFTSYIKLTPESLRDAIAHTHRTGFAEGPSPVIEGVYGLGIAIPDRGGSARLALSIVVHISYATRENMAFWKQSLMAIVRKQRG
jgi:DNA-binding IclR family transcriptional regulator